MSIESSLNERTSIFGLRLWADIGTGVLALIVLILFVLFIWLILRKKLKGIRQKMRSIVILLVSYGIKEVKVDQISNADPPLGPDQLRASVSGTSGKRDMEKVGQGGYGILPGLDFEEEVADLESRTVMQEESGMEAGSLTWSEAEKFEMAGRLNSPVDNVTLEGEKRRLVASTIVDDNLAANMKSYSIDSPPSDSPLPTVPEVSHLDWGNWGHWYALQDLEVATDCFSEVNILGRGGYGIVYRGQLPNGTLIAVKKLLNKRGQAEREFRVEVEAIGRVRHKNLVHLLGYCAEGHHRMLVYEYVDNGNLEQWLHGSLGKNNTIPWDIRMKIILGTAKGLAYLHEGLEPKVVHRDVKSSNILLDCQWNAKVSDFGLAKLLGSEKSHITTQVIGTFGYVAPEYASTGLLNEKSDVYGFGVLMMELITGREPVDYGRPAGEVNVVDWLKIMVASRRYEEVADPKFGVKPSSRALKRALLVALRCVDPDSEKRPKMWHVIHMLEGDDSLFGYSRRQSRDVIRASNIAHHPGNV